MAKKPIKRKLATKIYDQNSVEQEQHIDNEADNLLMREEEVFLENIKNLEEDSSDEEGKDCEAYYNDDSDELQFESDEEGNLQAKNLPINYNGNELKSDNSSDGNDSGTIDEESDDDDDDINSEDIEDISTENENASEVEDEKALHPITKNMDLLKNSVSDEHQLQQSENLNGNSQRSNPPPMKNRRKKLSDRKKYNDYKEYENSDTSDEEDIRNTVGNIPMHWYDEYKHIGYDWEAKKIVKPAKGDQIDDFLRKIEDPLFWRTVKDPQTGQEVILTDADIEIIKRVKASRVPDPEHNEYEPWIDWFTREVEKMPIKNVPDRKCSFLPSVPEKKKIGRMVHALKMGWMKTMAEQKRERQAKRGPKFYMLWASDNQREHMRRIHDHVPAPKRDLPGHAESYNPPPEYLFDEKEEKEWLKLQDEPHKRKLHFMPQKYNSLREVPAYPRYVRERFLRCLDLYLCPRARRVKLNIDAEYLIPKLPSPRDLQPFPTLESMVYKGHTDLVRTISIEPKGEYLVSGSDDKTVKIWEIATGRCIRTIITEDVVRCVAWCPNIKLSLIAVASGHKLLLINPLVGDKLWTKKTDDLLAETPQNDDIMDTERIKTAVEWSRPDEKEYEKGVRLVITHFKAIRQVTWHGRGDYFATVMPDGANRSAIIHQLSRRRSQIPFSKSKGLVQYVLFHPIKPYFFVATQHNVRLYDLVKQELIKKLLTNSKWISGMAIHQKGDNLLVSTYDKKILWFDLDLSTKPYQTIRLHKNAVRSVAFHLRYPLFASASDDLSVIVSHGMIYNDLLQNPLIVPLKKLQTHEKINDFGVLDVIWHPVQPWIFSAGADATIRLYS